MIGCVAHLREFSFDLVDSCSEATLYTFKVAAELFRQCASFRIATADSSEFASVWGRGRHLSSGGELSRPFYGL